MKRENLSSNLGLALLRIGASALIMTHGYGKLQMLFSDEEIQFGDPIGLGVKTSLVLAMISEFFAPILVLIGFKTRWATIPTIITMAVAAFIVHSSDPIGVKEMALLYLVTFITIALLGPGKYSVDSATAKKKYF